jgi:SAM-dependent methyltransferase
VDLETEFGAIDIYLFDQLLRGRITTRDRVFDAGCGWGRNLVYLLRGGFDVYAADPDPDAIAAVRDLARSLAPHLSEDRFELAPVERSSLADGSMQVVISSAVLHFARSDAEFDAMLAGSWRVLARGGMFFCRLASTIGIESRVTPLGAEPRRFRLPDGTDRYLVDEAMLVARTRALGGRLMDPIKTTVVQDQRAMTTWVVRKD